MSVPLYTSMAVEPQGDLSWFRLFVAFTRSGTKLVDLVECTLVCAFTASRPLLPAVVKFTDIAAICFPDVVRSTERCSALLCR